MTVDLEERCGLELGSIEGAPFQPLRAPVPARVPSLLRHRFRLRHLLPTCAPHSVIHGAGDPQEQGYFCSWAQHVDSSSMAEPHDAEGHGASQQGSA